MRSAFLTLLLFAAGATAAPPDPVTVFAPPPMPAPVPPAPAPTPVVPTPGPLVLTPDTLLVWDFDAPVVVLASPEGLVRVTTEAGPLRIRGRFADGDGKTQTREYKGKHVVVVEAVASGKVELFVVPHGLKGVEDVRRVSITVSAQDPIPPPKPVPPKPDDPVKPDPPTPGPKAKRLAVVVVEETQQRTVEQGRVLFDKSVRDWLKAGGHEIDVLDDDDAPAKANGYLPHAMAVGLPAVLVFDADMKGPQRPLSAYRLPASGAAWKAELERAVKP